MNLYRVSIAPEKIEHMIKTGIVTKELNWYHGRDKAYGYMLEGSLVLTWEGIEWHFSISTHVSFEREATREEALGACSLAGIKLVDTERYLNILKLCEFEPVPDKPGSRRRPDTKYFYLGWYARQDETGRAWLQPKGWFSSNKNIEQYLSGMTAIMGPRKACPCIDDVNTMEQLERELTILGFVQLPELNKNK